MTESQSPATLPPRSPGTARWRLILAGGWLALSALLGGLLFVSRGLDSPLDDRNLAYQRPGYLDPNGPPYVALRLPGPFPRLGHMGVAFFARPADTAALVSAVQQNRALRDRADIVIVLGAASPPAVAGPVPVVADPTGSIALAYGMRQPRDGGPAVGYAVVDMVGLVRYATLDPGAADRLGEVETILDATS